MAAELKNRSRYADMRIWTKQALLYPLKYLFCARIDYDDDYSIYTR